LKLVPPFRIEYYDTEFDEFTELYNIDDIDEKAKLRIVVAPRQGWQFSSKFIEHENWQTHGGSTTPYKSILLLDEASVVDPQEFAKLKEILKKCGGKKANLKQVYAIQNNALENAFLFYTYSLSEKFRSSPNLFKKEGWKREDDAEDRTWVYDQFEHYSKKFSDWSDNPDIPIIPAFQGTRPETPWKIAQTGFSTVATLDDGWYGRGIYFTSNFQYAKMYSKLASKGASLSYILLAFISPGNAYPIIEGPTHKATFKGKPGVVNPGYQSHYVLVNPPGEQAPGWPVAKGSKTFVDELVVFQDAQAVPKYILVVSD